jgi:photosystem II stability/assembly factor-like uncharacterized protein
MRVSLRSDRADEDNETEVQQLRELGRKSVKAWLLAGACALIIAAGATRGHGAIEGQVRSSAPPWLGLFGAAIRPDGSIFIVGSKALLLVSTDHGKTWVQQTLKERPGSILFQDRDLYSIRFTPDGKEGWIVGEEGTILHTADGGQTWTRQDSGSTKNLFKLAVLDAQNAVAVGADGVILRTSDDGNHWQSIKSPKIITLFDVTFVDKNTGWIAGEFSSILGTSDGGQTWKLAYGGNTGDFTVGPFFTVNFRDPQNGMAAGLSGDMVATTDGGKSWKAQKLPTAAAGYVAAWDPLNKTMWIGGTGGNMFSENVGGQFQEAARTTFHDLTDMVFAGNQGVAVGLSGTILLKQGTSEQWQAVQ